jgi:hypothetical protein
MDDVHVSSTVVRLSGELDLAGATVVRAAVVSGAGPEIVRVFRLAGIDEEVRFAPDVRAAI